MAARLPRNLICFAGGFETDSRDWPAASTPMKNSKIAAGNHQGGTDAVPYRYVRFAAAGDQDSKEVGSADPSQEGSQGVEDGDGEGTDFKGKNFADGEIRRGKRQNWR